MLLLARQLTVAMLWLVVCWLLTALKSTSFGWIGYSILGRTGSLCSSGVAEIPCFVRTAGACRWGIERDMLSRSHLHIVRSPPWR